MSNIPPLKKVLPTSPDQIQRFSSEGEAALARMAHLNRAALYIGNEIATDTVSFSTDTTFVLSKPCGLLTITDLGITANFGRESFQLIFNETAFTNANSNPTPAFVQVTLGTTDSSLAVLEVSALPIIDGYVTVRINNIGTTNDIDTVSFFYTVIPQLS
jgi:hypothetical protein